MKRATAKVRPLKRRTLRALGGRRVVIENLFGKHSPIFIAIAAGDQAPIGAWLSRGQLRRLAEAARRILQ